MGGIISTLGYTERSKEEEAKGFGSVGGLASAICNDSIPVTSLTVLWDGLIG